MIERTGGNPVSGPVVHQAEGILCARHGITIGEASRFLLADAEAEGTTLAEAARRVVDSLSAAREARVQQAG
ncbi:MAG TPA: ANTAR domain-containing protein [Actinomycetospora sp.]|jgi:AmiR/NasT family two-component response regulator|uniref:ANTAR domain-containing protein n=1 Tax=Actinomycetospora sp. TaxID=1872135 RepID=UPI002F4064EA